MTVPNRSAARPARTGRHKPDQHAPMPRVGQLGEMAVRYAAKGLLVLPLHHPVRQPDQQWGCSCDDHPCRSIGKHPCTWHGLNDASCDPAQVALWWQQWPLANIGLVCGHQFDVLDIDGSAGVEALRGLLGAEQTATLAGGPAVRTGGGGWHYYLTPTGHRNAQPVRGLVHVDWRGRGGYVVAPPSRHASGTRYRWARPLTDQFPTAPAALLTLLTPPATRQPVIPSRPVVTPRGYAQGALAAECAAVATTSRGGRNTRLWEAARNAYNFVATGLLDDREVEEALLAAAEACQLLTDEPAQTIRTIRSGRQVGLAHPRSGPRQPRQRRHGRLGDWPVG